MNQTPILGEETFKEISWIQQVISDYLMMWTGLLDQVLQDIESTEQKQS